MLYKHLRWALHQMLAQNHPHWTVYRITTDKWRRTWQCEWDGAPRAYRAYTSWGALHRALRAAQRWAKLLDGGQS